MTTAMTTDTDGTPPESAAQRWERLIRARLDLLTGTNREGTGSDPAFWDQRARRYDKAVGDSVAHDPLFGRLLDLVDPDTTVLDAGAGTGRVAVALAPHVREVIAVDPSEQMLAVLEERADAAGVSNVRVVRSRLEDVGDLEADVAVSAHVVTVVPDARGFFECLDRVASRRAIVCLSASVGDVRLDPLWRWFHAHPRPPLPTHFDAMDVLALLGINPMVEIVAAPVFGRWDSMDDAVAEHLDQLRLEDTPAVRDQLTRLLEAWLHRDATGNLRPAFATLPNAILSWEPRR